MPAAWLGSIRMDLRDVASVLLTVRPVTLPTAAVCVLLTTGSLTVVTVLAVWLANTLMVLQPVPSAQPTAKLAVLQQFAVRV